MARLIASTELKERLSKQDILLIDVGLSATFSDGHIPSALNIPLDTLRDQAIAQRPDFAKKDYIIVYGEGHDADLSDQASIILEGLGFDRVGNFDGGRSAWYNAGYQLITAEFLASGGILAEVMESLIERDPDVVAEA